jgi:hypothetical protein
VRDPYQLASPVAFLHLAVDQPRCYLPLAHGAPSVNHLEPLTKVGRERIKVEVQAIAGEKREIAWSQHLSERVDESMGHGLCAGAELKHRKNLGEGIDGQPEPQHLCGVAQPGAQFVQLDIRKLELTEKVLVEALSVLPCAGEPGRDRGVE